MFFFSFVLKSLKALSVLVPKWSLGLYAPDNLADCFRSTCMDIYRNFCPECSLTRFQ